MRLHSSQPTYLDVSEQISFLLMFEGGYNFTSKGSKNDLIITLDCRKKSFNCQSSLCIGPFSELLTF